MRVCMMVKNSFEYDARVTREARALVDAGHEVTVLALHLEGVTARSERREDGIAVRRLPRLYGWTARLAGPATNVPGQKGSGDRRILRRLVAPGLPLARALNAAWLNALLLRAAVGLRPEVVHCHDLNTLVPGVLAARRTGARLVYDSHELATQRNDMTLPHRLLAEVQERFCLPAVNVLITTSGAWADYLASCYQIDRPTVLRNVPQRTELTPTSPSLRERIGLDGEEPIVLYQGSVQPNRGIEQAIDALRGLPRAALVVLGYGAHVPALRAHVEARGLGGRVHFLGPVPHDELQRWTAQADVGLCTVINSSLSYFWSLPNKLFEYVQAGIPQVTSDFPEMGAMVRELGVGEVCDPADPAAVAAALTRVLKDPEPYRRRARLAAGRHHWGVEQRVLLHVYDDLQAKKAP